MSLDTLDARVGELEAQQFAPYGGVGLWVPVLPGGYTWSSLGTTPVEADPSTNRYRHWVDFTEWGRYIIEAEVVTAAAAGFVTVGYSTDGVTWRYLSDGTEIVGGAEPPASNVIPLASTTANPREADDEPTDLYVGAQARVLLAPLAWTTTGTADPAVWNVAVKGYRPEPVEE